MSRGELVLFASLSVALIFGCGFALPMIIIADGGVRLTLISVIGFSAGCVLFGAVLASVKGDGQ